MESSSPVSRVSSRTRTTRTNNLIKPCVETADERSIKRAANRHGRVRQCLHTRTEYAITADVLANVNVSVTGGFFLISSVERFGANSFFCETRSEWFWRNHSLGFEVDNCPPVLARRREARRNADTYCFIRVVDRYCNKGRGKSPDKTDEAWRASVVCAV